MDSYDNNEDIKEKIAKIVTTYKIDNGKNCNENIQEKKKIMA